MNAPLPDHLLEDEIRAMLQRRADDVHPAPPPWRELAQRNGAVVISLRTGTAVDAEARRHRRHTGRPWFRGLVAAAVALILAMAGALIVQGGDPGGDAADGPEPLDVPSAGQTGFDETRATPLFPVTDDASDTIAQYEYLTDPTATAQQYLATVLQPRTGAVVTDGATTETTLVDDGDLPIKTATVAWSFRAEGLPENPLLAEGTVWLRNPERGARDTWLVVGVSTRQLWLTDIRRDGDTLSFTVDRSSDVETFPEAEVTVNSVPVGGVGVGEVRRITVLHPAGQVAIIQVQHLEDGAPVSVTATAVPAQAGGNQELPARVDVPAVSTTQGPTSLGADPDPHGAVVVVPPTPSLPAEPDVRRG